MTTSDEVDILLVDDNPRDAELILRVFRKCDLADRLVHVKDGQEALDWLFCEGRYVRRNACSRPKVVLLDVKLPKLDGIEVLKVIRDDPRTRQLPVVILTSSSEEQDIANTYATGGNSYIVKPVEFEAFSDVLVATIHYWTKINRSQRKCMMSESR